MLDRKNRVIDEHVPERRRVEAHLRELAACFSSHVRVEIVIDTVDISALGDRKPRETRGPTRLTTEVWTGFSSDASDGVERVEWEIVGNRLVPTRVKIEEPA